MILENIKDVFESIINIERSIGFRMFKKYVFLGILVLALCNFKYIMTEAVIFITNISTELHNNKMELRDEYMTDITPLLVELRIKSGADRVLYFEFHNSEENLAGVPFKFFDLIYANSRLEVPMVRCSDYRNVNSGMYMKFFNALKEKKSIICYGDDDFEFRDNYPNLYEKLRTVDKSCAQVIINVPGVKQPVGFIILEWVDGTPNESYDEEIVEKINELGIYYATKCR